MNVTYKPFIQNTTTISFRIKLLPITLIVIYDYKYYNGQLTSIIVLSGECLKNLQWYTNYMHGIILKNKAGEHVGKSIQTLIKIDITDTQTECVG